MSSEKRTRHALRRSPASRRRARARGAVLVEACVIISVLTLGFMGLVFFRAVYERQLHSLRLANASIIAHGMGGCDANYPEEWIGDDLGQVSGEDVSHSSQAAESPLSDDLPSAEPPDTGSDSRAGDFMESIGDTTADGGGFMNEIVANDLNGRVVVGSPDATSEAQRFTADVRARSYVSCGDRVIRDSGFGDAFDYVGEIMSDLMSLSS